MSWRVVSVFEGDRGLGIRRARKVYSCALCGGLIQTRSEYLEVRTACRAVQPGPRLCLECARARGFVELVH